MAVQKKASLEDIHHGKGRLDKWYKLAKEKGYRARAAFKLIQLNRKYNFLEKSKVLLDLCAAPGSWCQVAAETMPAESLIIGVDLAPIKPIPRTITFQGDITSDKCRATIRQHLKTWKADTVLHDGAPNVGTAWVQDAFSQAELALQAMKLATEFLREGGTFVTKVFRSKDYNALLWVFKQLFTKVEATKPPSSRTVSAEIFVVCRGFKAPKHIDPNFLDPRSVFAELKDPKPSHEAKVFNPEKKKRKRDGYEEGDYTQFKEIPASNFIQGDDPISILGSFNRLSFEQDGKSDIALAALTQMEETTPEIRSCCGDLKVLGRKDFRNLLGWRLKARKKFGMGTPEGDGLVAGKEVAEVESMDEELRVQEELQALSNLKLSRKKRERRRENERKQREIVRMQMHMLPATEIGLEQAGPLGEDSVFSLRMANRGLLPEGPSKEIRSINSGQEDLGDDQYSQGSSETDEERNGLDRELEELYGQYLSHKMNSDEKSRAKQARIEINDEDWTGFSDKDESNVYGSGDDNSSSAGSVDQRQGCRTSGIPRSAAGGSGLTQRAASFFDQDIFAEIEGIHETECDDSPIDGGEYEGEKNKVKDLSSEADQHSTQLPPNSITKDTSSRNINERQKSQTNVDGFNDEDGFTVSLVEDHNGESRNNKINSSKERISIDIITAEAMTLAQKIASGEISVRDVVDSGFNKYALQDRDGLPEWFLDDEDKHSKPHKPISAAGAAAIKEKLRVLNARPIKKVREAKDRKKFKAAQKLEKLKKKSALLVEDEGMTEKDKAQSIARLMSKAAKKKPKSQVKVVVARGGNKGIAGRPRGVKGKYKIVDARLKKDVRAEKRLAKKRR
ncbi:MAG: AdoMet-dependent rRNA methyltransferase spb1 [Icmadophila ericetorum]|nr:AdoMet-dependent rRNA methyltransferase spb1 [Icmadophila ericetorum]